MNEVTEEKAVLTLAEYDAMPAPERKLLRRAAYGAPGIPDCFVSKYDLPALRAALDAREDETRWMPEKWTDQVDEEGA